MYTELKDWNGWAASREDVGHDVLRKCSLTVFQFFVISVFFFMEFYGCKIRYSANASYINANCFPF